MLVNSYLDSDNYRPERVDERGDWALIERDPLTRRDLRGLKDPVQTFIDVPYFEALREVVGGKDYIENRIHYSLERNILVESMVWDRDVDDVMDLEGQVFLEPWNPSGFVIELDNPSVYGVVARYRDNFLGFSINWNMKPKFQFRNIAIAPEWRRERAGMRLVDEGFETAVQSGSKDVLVKVPSMNKEAIEFFEGLWFYRTRTVQQEGQPDKCILEYRLPSALDYMSLPRMRESSLKF